VRGDLGKARVVALSQGPRCAAVWNCVTGLDPTLVACNALAR
jgi:hypothetical protein